ncbi:MAG TPA: PQQ-dependent sugar dehydrogenase [Gemmatimonadales bacterium]|nr:PQQ-dependent sugar dehydrogenase [Gemmatimonadales bacterium]
MTRVVVIALVALLVGSTPQVSKPVCAPDNAGLTLQPGFCALLVAESIGPSRHLVVLENGDVLVAVGGARGGIRVLRDTTGDGKADVVRSFGVGGGTGIAFAGEYLYFATNNAVVRWHWQIGALEPSGGPDTVVSGLTDQRQHAAKSIVVGSDGQLYVNIGAPSNSCQVKDRNPESPGQDPCPILDIAGGIWRFDPRRGGQTQSDGQRFATGLRNAVALAVDPGTGSVFAAQHGRDQLSANWPKLYSDSQSAELPAEVVFRLEAGGDYGWPYCYYDWRRRQTVLMPEYGGDGKKVGRCETVPRPVAAFPGHWAPDGMTFYNSRTFPLKYRGGVFIAFHGSWNRAPLPQAGYKVMFVPIAHGVATGPSEVFADGFAGPVVTPNGARYRPTGVAVGPDGSLYVASDQGEGAVFRIVSRP